MLLLCLREIVWRIMIRLLSHFCCWLWLVCKLLSSRSGGLVVTIVCVYMLSVCGETGDKLSTSRSLAAQAADGILWPHSAHFVVVWFSASVAGVSCQLAESDWDCSKSVGQKYVAAYYIFMYVSSSCGYRHFGTINVGVFFTGMVPFNVIYSLFPPFEGYVIPLLHCIPKQHPPFYFSNNSLKN